jgi:nickel-dependent lactate racemase
MAIIKFPYEFAAPVDVPNANLIGIFRPRAASEVGKLQNVAEVVAKKLQNPIKSAPLRALVKPNNRVTILVDDVTRQTPAKILLPPVLDELESAGITRVNITVLMAVGTHRAMTTTEIALKLGDSIRRIGRVLNHDCRDEKNLREIGNVDDGTPIRANKLALDCELLMSIGHIGPHRMAGFSGGHKMLFPGVCGTEAVETTHWQAARLGPRKLLGNPDNPVRKQIEHAGELARHRFIVNAVLDPNGEVVDVFCGHPVAAHRAGCEIARKIYGVPIPLLADIVLFDSHPLNLDLWQASKAVSVAEMCARAGGVLILVAPLDEVIASHHPEVEKIGYRAPAEIENLLRNGTIKDRAAAAHLALLGHAAKEHTKLIVVSDGISAEKARSVGLQHANSANEALKTAFKTLGETAKVTVLHSAGETLPLLSREETTKTP